jgi:tyrosyl-tRNA synthetase
MKLLKSKDLGAFDISQEPANVREKYGNSGFGQGCLLARRLVENGVRFVEVQAGGWAMHNNIDTAMTNNGEMLDTAFSALVEDLEAKGMLKDTLVVLGSEFGRTPEINENAGRDHYPLCYSTVFAGGGTKGGFIYGSSDKDGKRPLLSREVIEENFQDYKNQIGKVLDLSKIEFRYTSEWLEPLTFRQVGELAEDFSVQQMLRRRNFSERYERGDEISLREFMYPLMQGYDSVVIKSDVEIGGFDQLFNLQAGRILQKAHGMPQQDIMTLQMLEGTDGRKMSTSWGNIITIVDEPNDMFGKIMSIKDDLMAKYFTLCTDVSDQDILDMELGMQNGDNPMQHKKRLAREIVAIYHSPDAAVAAQESWEATFSDGGIPDDAPEYSLKDGETLLDVLVASGIAPSRSEARRLIEANAVTAFGESGETVLAVASDIPPRATLRIGKKKFLKIV